jgi:nucleotide-binding universal stress UspA family protein
MATEDEILVLEEEEEAVTDRFKILVAVANPANALSLVRNTYRLCDAKDGQVELLHMVRVPDQVPLADAKNYMLEGKEAILEIMLYLTSSFPVSTTIRYCRNVARGVISVVREKKADMLIMGWHGKRRPSVFRMGSTVDPIIERSPSSIVIMKDCENKKFNRVLVPVAGGPNSALALEVASILVEKEGGSVVALTVDRGEGGFNVAEIVEEKTQDLSLSRAQISTRTIRSDNVVDAILEEAHTYDLIVLGTTREPLLRRVTRETIPEVIARRCDIPLVMVKASGGLRSWIKRWL